MNTKTKTLWINIHDDYRSGMQIICDDIPDDESSDFKFELPIDTKYRLYLVNEFPKYKVIYQNDCIDKDQYIKLSNKIFSQVHKSLPFVVTDFNCAYKKKGYFPKITSDIRNMPNIQEANIIKKDDDGCYFIIILDNEGNVMQHQSIKPI